MYQLSDDEVNQVSTWLHKEPLSNRMLAHELLDHICCTMEAHITQHTSLEAAYRHAFGMVCPEGARQIEEETFFLLTINKQLNMKRVLFSTGFLSTFLLSFGFLFKMLHWPGATMILTAGLASVLVTLGALILNTGFTLRSLNTPTRVRTITGLFCGLLLVTGSMFKILHYPGASVMILVGLVLLNFIFLPMFFYQLYRKSIA